MIRSAGLKAARAQAYRYGRMISLLERDDTRARDAARIARAWAAFIVQFSALDGAEMVVDYVCDSYERGRCGNDSWDDALSFALAGTVSTY